MNSPWQLTEGERRKIRQRARAALERALDSKRHHVKITLDVEAARELLALVYDRGLSELSRPNQEARP